MIMSTNESQHELTTPLGNIVEQEERTKEWHITSLCRLCQLLLMSHSEIMFYSEINLVLEIDSLLTIRTPLEAMSLFFMWL